MYLKDFCILTFEIYNYGPSQRWIGQSRRVRNFNRTSTVHTYQALRSSSDLWNSRCMDFLKKKTSNNFLKIRIFIDFCRTRIAKTPQPLLYLEFEYNLRKILKNILCYLVKLEYNSRKFDWEFNTTSESPIPFASWSLCMI